MKKLYFGLILVGLGLLSSLSVGKRVTSVDLRSVYPNIEDYNDGRSGYVLTAPRSADYRLATSDGGITLNFYLNNSHTFVQSRRKWQKEETSQPIGDEAFFNNETESEETFKLIYRRHNLAVCFGISPIHGSTNGRRCFSQTDRQELETTAKILDDAIHPGNPSVKVEDVRFYQVIGSKTWDFVTGCIMTGGYFFSRH